MSLLSKLKEAAVSKAAQWAEDKLGDIAGKIGGALGGNASKSYGSDTELTIKINGIEVNNENAIVTGVMIDSGMPPEAGICEIQMEILGYSIEDENEIKVDSEFAQIKVGQPLEIQMASTFSGEKATNKTAVFTGFVERIEYEIDEQAHVRFTLHGMDAKMWMMANKLTESRGKGKSLEQIIKSVINNYRFQGKVGKVSLLKNVKIKNTFYQVDQSDYEFLCMLADLTGSLFYVSPGGEINFCAPSKLGKPISKATLSSGAISGIRFMAGVWGTPQSVKVTSIDPCNPSKTISATSSSAKSIGSGKSSKQVVPQNYSSQLKGTRYVNITDNSIDSREQAQARADAEYNQRNLKFVETELRTQGNPKLGVGQGIEVGGFNAPFDNEYLIIRVKHLWGTFSDDKMYSTKLYLAANKFKPQGR